MKSAVAVLTVVLFAGLVAAQGKPPAMAGSAVDTSQHAQSAVTKDAGRMACAHGGLGSPEGQGTMPGMRPNEMGPGCCAGFAAMGNEGRPMWGPHFMPGRHFPGMHIFLKLLLLGLLLCGTVNILLTIIVSLDMARAKSFNGLWIPVLLIAGIPGSAIYALFRMGDRIQKS